MIRLINFSLRKLSSSRVSFYSTASSITTKGRLSNLKAFTNGITQSETYIKPPLSCAKPTHCISLRRCPATDGEAIKRDIYVFLKQCSKKLEGAKLEVTATQYLVILATQAYISLLEDDYVRDYLAELAKGFSQTNSSNIDVICACIDGLAPSNEELRRGQLEHVYEGISMFWSSSGPRLSEIQPLINAGLNDPCCLTFHQRIDDSELSSLYITMPLANTIFTNGRRSTLLVSKWQISLDSVKLIDEPVYKKKFCIHTSIPGHNCSIQIPARSLTAPRIIDRGFGNIVRRLRNDGQGSFPASNELEKAVTEARQMQNTSSDHNVWALIISPNILEREGHSLNIDYRSNQKFETSYLGNLIKRGAKICRVTSGGGGWGVKEGLLALDPESTFGGTIELQTKMLTSEVPLLEDYIMTLGNMSEQGALIQFLHTIDDRELSLPDPRNSIEIVLGSHNASDIKPTSTPTNSNLSIPGLFGCVSRSGMFFESLKTGSTKIDMPFSFFYTA